MRLLLAITLPLLVGSMARGQSLCDSDGVLDVFCVGPAASDTSTVEVNEVAGGALLSELSIPSAFAGLGFRFGQDAAVDAGRVLVGAPAAFERGEAFLYDAASGSLLGQMTPDAPLSAPGEDNEAFGASVDLQGRFALVGAPNTGGLGGFGPGAALLFDAATGEELQRFEFDPSVVFAIGTEVELDGAFANITGIEASGSFDVPITFRVALIPEPTTALLLLVAVGAATTARR